MPELTTPEAFRDVLLGARTIAILGAHVEPTRPAYYVPAYLFQEGYRLLPVNPRWEGRNLWHARVAGSLTDLTEPVDIVDLFRRSDALPGHLPALLAMQPSPRVVWMQLGVRHEGVCAQLVRAGIDVVQDRCILAEHRRLLARSAMERG